MNDLIKQCTCIHAGQDEIHGKNNRVMSPTSKGTHRCSVCGKEIGASGKK
jgi:hypothetical protein